MTARFDLHVHSQASYDAKGSIMDLALAAQEVGLHGFAVTDHDAVPDPEEVQDAMEKTGLLIVPGCEVTTVEGHLLAFGIDVAPPKGEGMGDTIAAIEAIGGVAAPSHPLRVLTGVGPTALRQLVSKGRVRLVEAHNARERRIVQENTSTLLASLDLPCIGGSDAHWVRDIGTAWTTFDKRPRDVAALLTALRKGRCGAEGSNLPRRQVWGHKLSVPWRSLRSRRQARQAEEA